MQYIVPVLALIVSFLVGSIPTGFVIGRMQGIDIRQFGSGNVGATNVFRTLGPRWGVFCLALDVLKGWAPTWVLKAEFFSPLFWSIDAWMWTLGLAAVAGHMFSPFLRFRGGKGVATTLGALLAIAPVPMGVVLATGLLIIWLTGYVSLASIVGSLMLPPLILVWGLMHHIFPWFSVAVSALLAAAIVWKHRTNIERLRAGTEKRIFDRARREE